MTSSLRPKPFLRLLLGGLAATVLSIPLLSAMGHAGVESEPTRQAQDLIDPKYRSELLFMQGSGTPTALDRWTFFFYDPTAPNNLREVRIENGKVTLFQPADLHRTVRSDLVFDPARVPVGAENALRAASDYAAKNQITYNATRALLRRPDAGQAPVWRVEMLQDGRSRGVIHTDPSGAFARYEAARPGGETAAGFFDDVKNTFLGIGGDLEQFFTGKRTVDQ